MKNKSKSDLYASSDRPQEKSSDSNFTPVNTFQQSCPKYEKLLNLYAILSEVSDPVRLQFEIDRMYQIARRECGLRSLAAFKNGFAAYLEQKEGKQS